jgi:hypothetical protein
MPSPPTSEQSLGNSPWIIIDPHANERLFGISGFEPYPVASVTMPERALEAPLWAIPEGWTACNQSTAKRAKVLNGISVHLIRGSKKGQL